MGGLVGNDPYSCKSHFRQIHNVIMPIYLSRRFQQGISKYFENYREFSLNLYRGVATSSPLHIVLFSEPSSRLRDTRALEYVHRALRNRTYSRISIDRIKQWAGSR